MRCGLGNLKPDLCHHAVGVRHRRTWLSCAIKHVSEHQVQKVFSASRLFDELAKPNLSNVSRSSLPSTLFRAEYVSHRMETRVQVAPPATSLCVRFSNSKLVMESILPGLGGWYQQHTRYGILSECTMAHMRSATSDVSTNVTRGRIRPVRTLILRLPTGLLGRVARVPDNLPVRRVRCLYSRKFRPLRR